MIYPGGVTPLIRPYADTEPALGAGPLADRYRQSHWYKRRNHGSMQERAAQQAQQQDAQFRSYVQDAAADSPASTADQLAKLADLRDRGVISAGDFEREKAKVLAA